jgi:predicted site-specific integrase-resolvase
MKINPDVLSCDTVVDIRTAPSITEKRYTVEQVAAALEVRPRNVYGWIKSGKIRPLDFNASSAGQRPNYRITESELQRFLDEAKKVKV